MTSPALGVVMRSVMAMGMPLLPAWSRWAWVSALGVVLVVHAWHVWTMSGRRRWWWHAGHSVMAAGMVAMYAVSQQGHAGLYWIEAVLYAALTVAGGLGGVALWRRDRVLNWLWLASTVDLLAMTYMALPAADRDEGVTYSFVAYLVVEALVWLSDPLSRLARKAACREEDTAVAAAGRNGAAQVATLTRPRVRQTVSSDPACGSMRLVADVPVAVRLTLVVMSASMGWMLVAMQTMRMTGVPMAPMHM